MSFFWPNKSTLETATWVLRDRLGIPQKSETPGFPTQLPRTEKEFNDLLKDAQAVVAENKWKHLQGDIEEFESLLTKYRSQYADTVANTKTTVAAAQQGGSLPSKPQLTPDSTQSKEYINILDEKTLSEQKKEFTSLFSEMSPEKFEKSLLWIEKMIEMVPAQKQTLARWVAGALLLNRLQDFGYFASIDRWWKIQVESMGQKDRLEVENKLNAAITTKKLSLDTIRTGILYMNESFRSYASSVIVDWKAAPDQTPDNYKKYLETKSKQNPLTPSERTFLVSNAKGAFRGFSMIEPITQTQDLTKIGKFIESNPGLLTRVEKQADAIITADAKDTSSKEWSTLNAWATQVGSAVWQVAGFAGKSIAGWIGMISTVMAEATKEAGPIWGLAVLIALIVALFKFPKEVLIGTLGLWMASQAEANGLFWKAAEAGKWAVDRLKWAGNDSTAKPKPTPSNEVTESSDSTRDESIFDKHIRAALGKPTWDIEWEKAIFGKIGDNSSFASVYDFINGGKNEKLSSLLNDEQKGTLKKYFTYIENNTQDGLKDTLAALRSKDGFAGLTFKEVNEKLMNLHGQVKKAWEEMVAATQLPGTTPEQSASIEEMNKTLQNAAKSGNESDTRGLLAIWDWIKENPGAILGYAWMAAIAYWIVKKMKMLSLPLAAGKYLWTHKGSPVSALEKWWEAARWGVSRIADGVQTGLATPRADMKEMSALKTHLETKLPNSGAFLDEFQSKITSVQGEKIGSAKYLKAENELRAFLSSLPDETIKHIRDFRVDKSLNITPAERRFAERFLEAVEDAKKATKVGWLARHIATLFKKI